MITAIILAVSPFIVNAVTNLLKSLPAFDTLRSVRNFRIRALAGAISLVYVILGMWIAPDTITDGALDTAVTTFLVSFVTWISSLGSYQAFFSRE